MADPFSVAVGILTVLGATGTVGKFLKDVVRLRNGPDILLALNNQLVELQILVQKIHDLLQQQSGILDVAPDEGLVRSLETAQTLVSKLENFIAYDLTVLGRDGGHLELDKSRWLRVKPRVQKLVQDVQANKNDLILAVHLLTSLTSLTSLSQSRQTFVSVEAFHMEILQAQAGIEDQMRAMKESLDTLSNRQQLLETTLGDVNASMDSRRNQNMRFETDLTTLSAMAHKALSHHHRQEQDLAKIKRNMRSVRQIANATPSEARKVTADITEFSNQCRFQGRALRGIRQELSDARSRSQSSLVKSESISLPQRPCPLERHGEISLSSPSTVGMRNQPVIFEMRQKLCDLNCRCACHRSNSFKSPNFLNAVLGSLFVAYQSSPWSSQACNSFSCRRRSGRFSYTYAFPRWMLNRVLLINMAYNCNRGPELILRMMKIRPAEDNLFGRQLFLQKKDEKSVRHVQNLLDKGVVSVLDVSPEGFTGLHYALFRNNFQLAELLIRRGADLYYEDHVGRSPSKIVWRYILTGRESSVGLLRTYFWDESQLEVFGFPDLHRAYFNISGRSFSNVLSETPRSAIDQTDAGGRTLLSWASERGDDITVSRLKHYGADPNKLDGRGMSCLNYSVYARDPTCMSQLLDSKADIEAKNDFGSTPLMRAAMEGEVGSLKVLIEHGADVNARDRVGFTALHLAASQNKVDNATLLLDSGAGINSRGENGNTPLLLAISSNSHDTLRLLLAKLGRDIPYHEGVTVLVEAAWSGDDETLRILHEATIRILDPYSSPENPRVGLIIATARSRRDNIEEWAQYARQITDGNPSAWFDAFKTLYHGIVSRSHNDHEDFYDAESHNSDLTIEEDARETVSEDECEDQEEWQDARKSPEDGVCESASNGT